MDDTTGGATDLASRLDAAVPHPTAHLDPAAALRAGRLAARRRHRHAAAGAAATVVLAMTAVTGVTSAPGLLGSADTDGPAVQLDPAGQGDRSTPARADVAAPPLPTVTTDVPVRRGPEAQSPSIDPDGVLVLPEDSELVGAVENPLGYVAPAYSWAVAYRPDLRGVGERWTVLGLRPDWRTDGGPTTGVEEDGSEAYDQPAEDAGETFAQWVQGQVDFGVGYRWPSGGLASEPYLDRDGDLILPDGAELDGLVDDPLGLPAPAASRAVAWTEAGTRRWAVLVFDPSWRPGGSSVSGVRGLVDGFALMARPAGRDADFEEWAAGVGRDGFVADAPPAWVGTP